MREENKGVERLGAMIAHIKVKDINIGKIQRRRNRRSNGRKNKNKNKDKSMNKNKNKNKKMNMNMNKYKDKQMLDPNDRVL